MTRYQTIDQIKSRLDARALSGEDKALIDAALARLASGWGVACENVKARLDAQFKAAGV